MSDAIRCGDYRTAFDDLKPIVKGESWLWDAIIGDAPFGDRTHDGARTCAEHDTHGVVDYTRWTASDVHEFVAWAAPRTRRWIYMMTSHDLIPAWEAAYAKAGWYPFADVPIIISGMGVRRQGDGPSSWALHGIPARARTREAMANPASNGTALWRTTPGGYWWSPNPDRRGQGYDKPVTGLKELVGDYSNPGDLVCDPLCGYGSTLVAAVQLGRRVVGAEIVQSVADEANAALANTTKWMKRAARLAAQKAST